MTTFLPIALAHQARELRLDPPLSDTEFEAFCRANEVARIERTREGTIRMNPPAGSFTSDGNAEITLQLRTWWKTHRRGRVYDATVGFYLPDGSLLSPDAAYVSPARLKGVTRKELSGFPHLCPDFVIELFSSSDRLAGAKRKMELWVENGAALGWLLDPYALQAFIYRPGASPRSTRKTTLAGEGPVAGFTLDLAEVWNCYEP